MGQLESHFEISELIVKFLEKRITAEEADKLKLWVEENEDHQKIWKHLTDPIYLDTNLKFWKEGKPEKYWKKLEAELLGRKQLRQMRIRKSLKYAAVFLGLMAMGMAGRYLIRNGTGDHEAGFVATQEVKKEKIVPQGKVAQLILADGSSVNLRNTVGETIIEKDGTTVVNGENMLQYSAAENGGEKRLYNTLVTPRGGEYRITLSDGTKVWLNAASSLYYPTKFDKNERRVVLSGEGYFEVAKDATRPFWVETGEVKVRVLGTKFNVSAYKDDSKQRVSLAEGSVKVEYAEGHGKEAFLKPGYGADMEQNKENFWVHKVNLESVLSWKDAMFIFDDESLGSIMKKLSRWYNVDVKYEDGVDTRFHFTGRIQRYEDISNILHLIEMTNKVKFEIVGREVKVGLR